MLRIAVRSCISRGFAQKAAPVVEQKIDIPVNTELFNDLKARIHGSTRSIDKIVVTVTENDGSSKEYLMNRHLSTPLTCAKHISRSLAANSGLAVVTFHSGASEIMSVNSRLDQPCDIQFIDFHSPNKVQAEAVNQAVFRSASVLTAAALAEAFPSKSAAPSSHKDGFFSAQLNNQEWTPSADQLKQLEKNIHSYFSSDVIFDILNVPESLALEYGFSTSTTICKLENFVCEVDGPAIKSPSQFGRFNLFATAVRNGDTSVAGVALPAGQSTSSFNWDLICQNAKSRFGSR